MNHRNSDLLNRAINFLASSSRKTEDVASDPDEINHLADKTGKKMRGIEDEKHNFKNFFKHLVTFQRMLRAYARREYPHLPWKSLLSIVGALLYFLNPLDIIPDFIPGIGLIDDITLLAWAYKSVAKDVMHFEDWEYSQQRHSLASR